MPRPPKRRSKKGRPPASRGPSPPAHRTVFSLSEEETFDLGRATARTLRGGELILLEGVLGIGKTVFARGVAVGLGVPQEDVASASFSLVQEYGGGRRPIFHVDLYRIEAPEELATLGLEEILAAGAVVLVEWGEKLPPYQRRGALRVRLHDLGEGARRIDIVSEPKTLARPRGDA